MGEGKGQSGRELISVQTGYSESPTYWSACDLPTEHTLLNDTGVAFPVESVQCHFQREVGLATVSHWVDRVAPAWEEPCCLPCR